MMQISHTSVGHRRHCFKLSISGAVLIVEWNVITTIFPRIYARM
jgi:hypothetical protein